MNEILKEVLETGKSSTPGGDIVDIRSSISAKEGARLQQIMQTIEPSVSLEVGLAYGISAMFICDHLKKTPQTRHYIIDPCQETSWKGAGLHNLRKAGYGDIIEFYGEKSYEALPKILSKGVQLDFAFIDGWHTFDYTLVDFFYVDKMLRVGGIVVLDDADWPGIRKLCRYITTNLSYSVVRLNNPGPAPVSVKRKLYNKAMNNKPLARKINTVFSHEYLEPDWHLGLFGTCIAFKKEADDPRPYDFHKPF